MNFIQQFIYALDKEYGEKIPYQNKKANDFCYKCGNFYHSLFSYNWLGEEGHKKNLSRKTNEYL